MAYGGEPGGDPERSTFYVYKGSEAKVYQIPNSAYYRAFSCVAFHPQNDDKIYNFGGKD